jgi:polyhydroxyalkanoate synthesis regulator protein
MHDHIEKRQIRKHRNRRLYDCDRGRVITQCELGDLVRAGHEVQIIDHATGHDITVQILGQIAQTEVSGWQDRQEGTNLYRSIITKGGDMSKSAINSVVLAGLGALTLTAEKAEEIVDALIKRGEVARNDRKSAINDLISKAEDQARKFSDTMKSQAEKWRGVKRDEHEDLKNEVSALKEMLKKMEEQLAAKD